MRQTNELDRVKARIKALAEKTVSNGCTEIEVREERCVVGSIHMNCSCCASWEVVGCDKCLAFAPQHHVQCSVHHVGVLLDAVQCSLE